MDRTIPLLLLGLFFGAGIGFTAAATNGIVVSGHDHSDPAHHSPGMTGASTAHASSGREGLAHASHGHDEILSLIAGPNAPQLGIEVLQDPASGWNLHIETRNFRFAPEHASGAHVDGEGHAHIYINGEKVARHYGNWFHIATLPTGTNSVEVTLNANDHRALAVGSKPLRAKHTVTVDRAGASSASR
ncbi:hypothetical protein [Stappia stellulata]|uniref:hypothetical protein n=1 Tax=Stappia stellulata TaxID=71235 RepID=UPI0004148EDD|nr:hypothetical protein [Stappia stellulata]